MNLAAVERFWRLIQPKARARFVALSAAVLMGGFVELAGIGVVASMMQLVASGGKNAPLGPMGMLFGAFDVTTPELRLQVGLVLSSAILACVHGFNALRSYLRNQFVWMQDKELTTRLFSAILERPYSWFLTKNSAELQHILLSGGVTQGVINGVLAVAGQLSVALTLGAALVWTDPMVAAVGIAAVGVAYALVRRGSHQLLVVKGGEAHHADRRRRRIAQEALTSIRFVKTTGRERFFLDHFHEQSERASKGMVYHAIYVDTVRSFLEWVTFTGILSLSVFLILRTQDFEALLPRLTLFTMATYRIVPAVHELFGLWSRLRFDSIHLKETVDVLESPTLGETVTARAVEGLQEGRPLVTFEKVEFRYPEGDRQILDKVDLKVGRREWIGIVGSTGAGKTTMLDLMSGLCLPTGGEIVVGSTPLTADVMEDWRSHIGVVPQEVILLDDTLRKNIAFGSAVEDIDDARVAEVCQAAGLAGLIEGLSEGYETSLGERGVRLSGGERQRVGIARALYRKPDLLLLDEATSALDQATEARIVKTLRELANDCTLVTVAHRLSSVKPCDRILVMEHGKIAAVGTYEELVRDSHVFRELAALGSVGGS